MPNGNRLARVLLLTVLALVAAGCAGDEPDTRPTGGPTPGPTTTAPDLALEIDLEEFVDCLEEGGISVEPEEDPRFEATAELQISIPTSEGGDNIGIFVYDSAADAEAAKPSLDETLQSFESPPSQQVGNVLVAGLLELAQDPQAQENVGIVLGCLGGIELGG